MYAVSTVLYDECSTVPSTVRVLYILGKLGVLLAAILMCSSVSWESWEPAERMHRGGGAAPRGRSGAGDGRAAGGRGRPLMGKGGEIAPVARQSSIATGFNS